MNSWQFTPFAILYFSAAVISFLLSFIVWKMRPVRGRTYFSLMAFFAGIWTLAYLLETFNANLEWKLIMLRIEYAGIISTNLCWLFFVSYYTNYDQWLSRLIRILIAIIPVVTFLQVLTVQSHDFFYSSYELATINNLVVTTKVYGPGFYLWAGFAYFIMITGGVILIRGIIYMPYKYRKQIIPLILVIVIVLAPNALYITGNNPISPYDPTCLAFVVTGIIFLMIMYFHKFLNIVPVAYYSIFNNAKNGVIIIDERAIILDVNLFAIKILNEQQKNIVGKNIIDFFRGFEDIIASIVTNDEIKTEIQIGENQNIYELQTTPLKDYKNKLIGRIIQLHDITEQKHALGELDAYARTVAHNLKDSITTVKGFVELLKHGDMPEREKLEYIQYIHDGASKMKEIIDGLLLLARVRNVDDIQIEPLSMNEIVNRVLSRLSITIREYNGKISKEEFWPEVMGYPLWVEEIWVNFITNALKYGGDPPKIDLGADQLGNDIRFYVKDNGKGLTLDEQSKLFKEFTQLKTYKKKKKGFGLGLSIVKRIAQKLNGDAGVESELGKGSTFYFTLPSV